MPEFPIVIAYVVISTTDKNDDANKPRLAPDRRGQNTIVQGVSLAHHCLAMSGMLLMEIESCGRGGVSRDAIDGCLLSSPSASPQELELASTAATWDRSWGAVTTVEHSPKGMVFNFDH